MEHAARHSRSSSITASQETRLARLASLSVSLGRGKTIRISRWIAVGLILVSVGGSKAAIVTFEDLTLPSESYWNGADGSGGFTSGGAFFENNYDTVWDSWQGFAYSNRTETQIKDVEGQYNAIAGSGQGGSSNYGVVFVGWEEPPAVTLTTSRTLEGVYVTNNNYVYYSMLEGSLFSKKFGGQTGADEDWFKLTITGKDAPGDITGTVEVYLADFRFADSGLDYIVDSWTYVDLSPLGDVKTLEFALDSSDTGAFGMNTPGYLCIDTIIPEPATFVLLGIGGLLAIRRRRSSRGVTCVARDRQQQWRETCSGKR